MKHPIKNPVKPVDGFVENADDCDDEDSEINPDADELCDDVDHNCDESTTDGAIDAPTWYYDADNRWLWFRCRCKNRM